MTTEKILMLDTETCNTLEDPIPYNFGAKIIDRKGNVYDELNVLIDEVYHGMNELMQTCYYAHKLPIYEEQIANGEIEVMQFIAFVKALREMIRKYNVKIWCAHNARFDNKSMNNLERYLTKSEYRYLLPFGMEAWDTMKMAKDVIASKASYRKFCEENGFMTKHATPRPRMTAEVLYRYISQDLDFEEAHRAMEDVDIETQILVYCFRQHKKMRKSLWENA